jgi:hypothetical protein
VVAFADTVPLVLPAQPTSMMSSVGLTTPQLRRADATVAWSAGTDIDFTEAAVADRMSISGSVNLRPTDRLRLNATYTSTSYRRKVSGQQSSVSRIPRLKAEYQVARPIFVRVVSQYQAIYRAAPYDLELGSPIFTRSPVGDYVSIPASGSDQWRSDFLFSYRPNPGTVVFAGYGSTFLELENSPLFAERRRSDDAFFVKLSYLFGTSIH